MRLLVLTSAVLLAVTGCGGGGGGNGTSLEPGPSVAGFAFTDESSVAEGQPIEPRFTCDGDDLAPGLSWTGVPKGTRELALVLEDPDAPGDTFTHWLVYGIDSGVTSVADADSLTEGRNDFGDQSYRGPCPPGGEEHRYVFRLLALDALSGLAQGVDRADFDDAVAPHLLAEARLTATYARE